MMNEKIETCINVRLCFHTRDGIILVVIHCLLLAIITIENLHINLIFVPFMVMIAALRCPVKALKKVVKLATVCGFQFDFDVSIFVEKKFCRTQVLLCSILKKVLNKKVIQKHPYIFCMNIILTMKLIF